MFPKKNGEETELHIGPFDFLIFFWVRFLEPFGKLTKTYAKHSPWFWFGVNWSWWWFTWNFSCIKGSTFGISWKIPRMGIEIVSNWRFHSFGEIITTSAEVTLNGGLVRASPQNPLNSGRGIILICPDSWLTMISWDLQRGVSRKKKILFTRFTSSPTFGRHFFERNFLANYCSNLKKT